MNPLIKALEEADLPRSKSFSLVEEVIIFAVIVAALFIYLPSRWLSSFRKDRGRIKWAKPPASTKPQCGHADDSPRPVI